MVDHLAEVDALRQGIGLRSYGAKNPKLEFRRESFELFNMCNKLGVVKLIDKKPEGSHWDNLKIQYLKDNPNVVIFEGAMPK